MVPRQNDEVHLIQAMFDGRSFDAFLFDMDGTLISSIEATERVWTRWAARFGIDAATFLPHIHGQRAVDSIKKLGIEGIDPEREAHALTLAEIEDIEGVHAIAGAHAFLQSLPRERWAVVTSATHALATRRLKAANCWPPPVLITAEDIVHGKPAPDCYVLAAQRLGFTAERTLVFEDAHAGVRAGEAAGASVLVISATHREPMQTPHPRVRDYEALRVVQTREGSLQLAAERT